MDVKLTDFETFHNVINNELTTTPTTRHAIDPNNAQPLWPVPVSTAADVDAAVSAARAAFPAWSALTYDERTTYLLRFADAVKSHAAEFSKLLAAETGKPPSGVGLEISMLDGQIRGTLVHRLPEETIENGSTTGRRVVLRHVPLGVGVGILPWNFPMVLGVAKLASALLVGNTFIWKASPYSPYTALKLGEIGAKVFPKGVFNVLSGGDDLGRMLTAHPGVDKVSFTGSVASGKKVMVACAGTMKRVTLELGGNDAAIVCEDADLAAAVPTIAALAFVLTGQVCFAIKRIYVHASIYDAFLSALVAAVQGLKVGTRDDPEAILGPLQNSMQYTKVGGMYSEIDAQGWKTALGGNTPHPLAASNGGYYMTPTVVDNPPEDARIVTEEQFGPIVPLLKWTDEDDVIQRANNTRFGLGGSVWSKDVDRAEKMARRLEAGTVWVNTHFEVGPPVGFGGFKESGVGVECGVDGLKAWCNPQAVCVRK